MVTFWGDIFETSNLHNHQLGHPGCKRPAARDNSRGGKFLSSILGYLFYNSRSCFPNDRFSGFGRDDLGRFFDCGLTDCFCCAFHHLEQQGHEGAVS